VKERALTWAEVQKAPQSGDLLEAFGTGTAAVISPIGELACATKKISLSGGKVGELTQRLYDEITAIQYGEKPDTFGWTEVLA
jgi:branched-chain amino acid aminotransferase